MRVRFLVGIGAAALVGAPSAFAATEQPRSYSSITAGPAASVALARKTAIASRLAPSSEKGLGSQRSELTSSSLLLKR